MNANLRSILIMLFGFISACTTQQENEIEIDNRPLLGTGLGINKTTVFVQDLDSARNYYTKVLGFPMPLAKDFQNGMYDGTLSAVVNFPDMSSLELLSVKDTGGVVVKDSFITSFLKHNEGVRLYSLHTSSADSTIGWLRGRGYKIDSARSGRSSKEISKGWDWDDGGPQWLSVELNSKNPPAYLPGFVNFPGLPYKDIQDYWKPYSGRKYYDSSHNGAVGITSLLIVVDSLMAARNEFKKAGFTELKGNDSIARFKITRAQELHLVEPRSPREELSKFLKVRGPGVYAIRFEVRNYKETFNTLNKNLPARALRADSSLKRVTVLKEYAYGVQLEFMEESKEQAELARIYGFKEGTKLDSASIKYATATYIKYCALCHGKDREGHAADHAPSLRSQSLMATTQKPRSSYNFLSHAITYGRPGTAMAAYAKEQGGPLDWDDIELLIQWLHESSGVEKPIEMSAKSVTGNVAQGKALYAKYCANCHGAKGEGVRGPALANPMFLATASDAFLRYAITEGRDKTPMPSFKDSLSKVQIDAVTAYLRSRASGWNAPESVNLTEPLPKDYVLNPNNKAPKFTLRENRYISAEQLLKALKDSARIVILDARSKAAWHQTHIPGAISVPYYDEPDKFIKDIPKDSTWIVAYCACPRAASNSVVNTLRRFGYKHTAVLDEGILVWAQRGYPVQYGLDNKGKKNAKTKK